MRYLVDTDWIADYLKGEQLAVDELDEDLAITPLLRDAEVMDKELSTNPEFLALIERARAQQQAEGDISSAEMRRRWGQRNENMSSLAAD